MKTKPSDFITYPWNSVMQNSECETIARNIMIILKRTGNTFRKLSWKEYKEERIKDKKTDSSYFSDGEEKYFDKVIDYCQSVEKAKTFSSSWAN